MAILDPVIHLKILRSQQQEKIPSLTDYQNQKLSPKLAPIPRYLEQETMCSTDSQIRDPRADQISTVPDLHLPVTQGPQHLVSVGQCHQGIVAINSSPLLKIYYQLL